MTIDMGQFKEMFFEESAEALSILESGLLNLDADNFEREEIDAIFRAAHSIKGGSATFGMQDVASFTHLLETLLDEIREGARQPNQDIVSALLNSVDCLREMIQALRSDEEIDIESVKQSKSDLENILGHSAEIETEVANNADATDSSKSVWKIRFIPDSDILLGGNDPLKLIHCLEDLGDFTSTAINVEEIPKLAALDTDNVYIGWDILLQSDATEEAIRAIFGWVEDDCELSIECQTREAIAEKPVIQEDEKPLAASSNDNDAVANKSKKKAPAQKKPSSSAAVSSIRVSTDKIDDLINMVGELVITQSMLSVLSEDFSISRLEHLTNGLAMLERHTRALQENVLRIRMLPISSVFNRFPRLTHDLSRQLNKKVDLKITGETTELDKSVIELIGDPLVHLVRNSMDHGLECPETRKAAGKPETGILHLHAYHKGGNIVIEISDDGAGINREKVSEIAVERGLLTQQQIDELSPMEVDELIFKPGFSTADEVSDVSGRGVGMDVVRKNITNLSGSIELHSNPGKGTLFRIRLPLTLAILDGQILAIGSENYIIPLPSIVESIMVYPEQLRVMSGKAEVVEVREQFIPIVRLNDVLGINVGERKAINEGIVVIVEGDGELAGFFVDELLGQQQVVIKSLSDNFKRVPGFSGATILGNGSVALILDVPELIKMAAKQ